MKRNLTISLVAGVCISAVALYLAFRNVPVSDLLHYFGAINYAWIIPSIALALFSFVLRVYRWRIILASTQDVGFWRAFHPLMIGFMINCILPGRVGEVVRPVILKKRDRVPVSTGLATVVTERVFDIVMLMSFFAVVLATVQIRSDLFIDFGAYRLDRGTLEMVSSGMLKVCILLIVGIVSVSFSKTRNWINGLLEGIPGLFFFLNPEGRGKIRQWIITPLMRSSTDRMRAGSASPSRLKGRAGSARSKPAWLMPGFRRRPTGLSPACAAKRSSCLMELKMILSQCATTSSILCCVGQRSRR